MLAAGIGPRTSHSALTLIHMTAAVVSGIPGFFSGRRVVFFQACSNVARPHHSLRVEWSERAPVGSELMHPKWQQRTPGMAVELTDHVWTF
jgi:hypothetical protein